MSNYAGAFLIVSAIIVGYFLVVPQWDIVTQLSKEGEYLDTVNLELDTLMQTYLALNTTLDRVSEDDRNRIEQAIPRGPQRKDFMVDMEHFASVAGIYLADVVFNEPSGAVAGATGLPAPSMQQVIPQNVGIVKELNMAVTIEGSYANFKKFLTIIEKNLPIIDVEDIKFTSSKTDEITFNFGLKSYYQ